MATAFDVQALDKALQNAVLPEFNKAMEAAAEPVIQKALAEIERKMRERMAECLISLIRRDMQMHIGADVITIQINQAKKQA